MPSREAMAMHHPSDLLGRPYADQLVHQVLFLNDYVVIIIADLSFSERLDSNFPVPQQVAAHEQLQRQLMMERERFPHPSIHDEYLR